LITYLFIASEKVDKTIAALLGAGCVIMLHLAPYEELLEKVDLNVIFLLIGMMVIVNILSTTGIFEWLAVIIAKKTQGNGIAIFLLFLIATAFLSAILDNVTTIILIAPITILITQILEIPTAPALIFEAVFSNIGGTATLVGDPPNILIGSQTNLTFNDFLLNLAPAVIIIMLITAPIIIFIFRKAFNVSENTKKRILTAKPEKALIRPDILKKALPVFALTVTGFFLSRTLEIEPGIIALSGAFLMALVCKSDVHKTMEKVEWNTILFFVGLFLLIGALEANHVFEEMGKYLMALTKGNLFLTALAVLWFSAIFSAIVDNIPLVMAMIPLIKSIIPIFAAQMSLTTMPGLVHSRIEAPLFWALALGACLGGNGSLVGASANVVVSQIANRNKYKISFWNFTRYGAPVMLASLAISSVYIYCRYFL
jgi:Na+/H+ antiporter NhaD/arsenite permease-like protein